MKKKYLKIFSKAVRRMKLKLYMHAYDINLYKVCVFTHYRHCTGNDKITTNIISAKWEITKLLNMHDTKATYCKPR